jgi:hypothetical protein
MKKRILVLVAEHWDVMQEEVPAAQCTSGNSMLTTSQS